MEIFCFLLLLCWEKYFFIVSFIHCVRVEQRLQLCKLWKKIAASSVHLTCLGCRDVFFYTNHSFSTCQKSFSISMCCGLVSSTISYCLPKSIKVMFHMESEDVKWNVQKANLLAAPRTPLLDHHLLDVSLTLSPHLVLPLPFSYLLSYTRY